MDDHYWKRAATGGRTQVAVSRRSETMRYYSMTSKQESFPGSLFIFRSSNNLGPASVLRTSLAPGGVVTVLGIETEEIGVTSNPPVKMTMIEERVGALSVVKKATRKEIVPCSEGVAVTIATEDLEGGLHPLSMTEIEGVTTNTERETVATAGIGDPILTLAVSTPTSINVTKSNTMKMVVMAVETAVPHPIIHQDLRVLYKKNANQVRELLRTIIRLQSCLKKFLF